MSGLALSAVVTTHEAVAATRRRSTKGRVLGELLASCSVDERSVVVPWISGGLRQGRIGVGWAALKETLGLPPGPGGLTVSEVDGAFDGIAEVSGKGSKARRQGLLDDLLGRCTVAEQRFLRSLLSGELRQGAQEGVVADAVAQAAEVPPASVRRAAMLCGDLAAAALAAFDGEEALQAFQLEPLRAVQPMLAQTASDVAAAVEAFDGAIVEAKLDGVRIQVHRRGDEVRVFSRQLRELTRAVPEVVEAALALPVDEVVLDGEVLAYQDDGRPHAFQTTMRRFGRKLDVDAMRRELPLVPAFFDLLYRDGRSWIDEPLRRRREALAAVVSAEQRFPSVDGVDPSAADAFLRATLEAGHEGVMVKDPESLYEAGHRGSAWLKVKPAWTLDLVVLAAEWGSGRRQGMLSNLHLGCRDGRGGFVMLGKTFKGLTDELLAWQTRELLARELRREGHVVHVRPELVVEVAFNEVQASPRYPGGLALRFARVKGYRVDKDAVSADAIELVRAIHDGTAPWDRRDGL